MSKFGVMNYILFDGAVRNSLLPLTYTRPVAELRIGILTIREKWERFLGSTTTTITEDYLEEKYPMVEMDRNVMINASFLPTEELIHLIKDLKEYEALYKDEEIIAFYTSKDQEEVDFDNYNQISYLPELLQVKNLYDIFIFRLMQFWGTYRGYAQRGPITTELRQTFYYPGGLTYKQPQTDPATMSSRIEYT